MSCPTETVDELVDGFASIGNPDRMAAFALAVAGTALSMMVETAKTTGAALVVNVADEVHVDHLRAPVHHPPTP